ncbi:MAG TPA: hypothetical protein QF571_07520 [Desulfobacterales bacterium]|nr:hypothetical protein [Desulfobacterales bacterium]
MRKGSILLTPEVEDILLTYGWPGNVREVRNMMEHAVILCEGSEVTVYQLPGEIQSSDFVREQTNKGFGTGPPLLKWSVNIYYTLYATVKATCRRLPGLSEYPEIHSRPNSANRRMRLQMLP